MIGRTISHYQITAKLGEGGMGVAFRGRGMALLFGLLSLVATSTVWAQVGGIPRTSPESVGMSSDRLARISSKMKSYIDEGHLSGTVTAVVRRGKLVYLEAQGLLDMDDQRPMREDALFRIYSMTKPITSVAVMLLQEEGRLLLNDPVANYLPEFGRLRVYRIGGSTRWEVEAAGSMTIRHLLTHTSGLAYPDPEWSGVSNIYADAGIWNAGSLEEFASRIASLPLAAQPGTAWNYGVSMDVLGRLIEVVSGVSFDRFLHDRIFQPLRMENTAFWVPPDKRSRLASIYEATTQGGLKELDEPFDDPEVVPYGGQGLVSTASDFLRFAQMLANGGELDGVRLLSPTTVSLMMADHLGDAFGPEPLRDFGPWLPSSARGVGFGLDGAVVTDVAGTGVPGSNGSYFWAGAASTHFWIDRQEQLVGLLLTQLKPVATYPLRAEMRVLSYGSLIEQLMAASSVKTVG